MRKTVLWLIMVTAASGPAGPAAAWNGNTHDELGRQTMLYLLRSSIPDLRLAGVVLAAAGEGMLSGAQPTRRWALAREAEDVDHYREVAIKNDGMTIEGIVPKIMYSFMGHNFAAFNHFILWGKQIPDAHDNQPGYTLEKDASDDDLLEYLKQAGTGELDDLCTEKATQLAQDWADDTWWVKPVNKVSFGLVGKALGWLAGTAARGRCPKLRVSHDDSPALSLYTNNSSTAKRSDFVKQLTPTRFHPVDNIGSAGLSLFLSSSHGQRAQLLSDVLYGGRIVGLDPKSGAYGPLHPVVAWHQACKANHDLATCARYIKVVGPDGLKNARCWSELTMAGGKTQSNAQIDIDQLVDRIVEGCKQGDARLCNSSSSGATAPRTGPMRACSPHRSAMRAWSACWSGPTTASRAGCCCTSAGCCTRWPTPRSPGT